MAYSLEAALVVPLSLSLVVGLTGQVKPLLRHQRAAAVLVGQSQVEQLTLAVLYEPVASSQTLKVSPQRAVELIEWLQLSQALTGLDWSGWQDLPALDQQDWLESQAQDASSNEAP